MGEPGLATLGGEKLKLCEWGILFGLGKSCGETAADKSISGGKRERRGGKGRVEVVTEVRRASGGWWWRPIRRDRFECRASAPDGTGDVRALLEL